jgi:hypothetical protein
LLPIPGWSIFPIDLWKVIAIQNACFAIGNGTVQNFAENKGEITGISFQKVDDHEGIVQAISL